MEKKMKRLGIFVFFDPQGIVDSYVKELLRSFRPHFEKLVIISNCELDYKAKCDLEQYGDAVYSRENSGLDAAAFKEGLVSFCGWDEVEQYDEVVLINDTYFGPILSFDDMFETMADRDLDFWGISCGYQSVDGWGRIKYGYTPPHIQTFFVAFRKEMVCSEAFRSYWHNYDHNMNDFVSVVTQHEMVMTRQFEDLGFRWGIYADTERYCSVHKTENFTVYHHHPHWMLSEMNFPVLKKKVLNVSLPDHLYMNDLEDTANAMRYIQNETDYDSNLIWDNALRLYNTIDLYQSLHLNYVLPSVKVDQAQMDVAAVVFYVTNPFFTERVCARATELSEYLDVYILPESRVRDNVREILTDNSKVCLLDATNQSMEMGGFVLGCKELVSRYSYIGFLHDMDNPMHYPTTIIESTVYGMMQNVANDANYISQVLQCFHDNPRLGVLGTPFPIHHHGFGTYGNEWGCWYDKVKGLTETLDLRCKIDYGKSPLMITGAFWCRTAALSPVFENKWSADMFYGDPLTKQNALNEALKRVLPFVAQSEGYYSGIVMHTDYASMRLTSQQYMLDQIVHITRNNLDCNAEFLAGYMNQLRNLNIHDNAMTVTVPVQIGVRQALANAFRKRLPMWLSSILIRVLRLEAR